MIEETESDEEVHSTNYLRSANPPSSRIRASDSSPLQNVEIIERKNSESKSITVQLNRQGSAKEGEKR
jgi:hypothetical protein